MEVKVVIRLVQINDKAFIFSSYLHGNYYGHKYFNQMDKEVYFESAAQFLKDILLRSDTQIDVATLEDDFDHILGFIIYQGKNILWVYVKNDYRKSGIARMLYENKGFTTITNATKSGAAIAKKLGLIFNPFVRVT